MKNKSIFSKLNKKILKKIVASFPANSVRIWGLKRLGYNIGEDVYLGNELMIITESGFNPILTVNNRVSIGPRVTFMLASGSNNSKLREKYPLKVGDITIEEDVWIGTGVIIYPNVKIGKCAIIAAGAVVVTNVSPYSIVGGVPAKQIGNVQI